ncbi:hypothetical protein ACFL2Y_03485, partial [Candidatus Omnitrophota bacterium]
MKPNEESIPEEKLLNLIRHSNKKSPRQKNSSQADVHAEGHRLSKSMSSSTNHDAVIKKEENIIFDGIKSLNFVLINRLILVVALVAFLLLLFDLFFRSPDLSKLQSSSRAKLKEISLKENKIKSYSYYQQEIAKRQLFNSSPIESKVKKVIPAGQTFKELIKGLKLLGIVSGDKTQVIIEDTKLRKTYFLYVGDYLGEIKVEEVHSDRVILEFKGERIS